jgi:hypothetical protein
MIGIKKGFHCLAPQSYSFNPYAKVTTNFRTTKHNEKKTTLSMLKRFVYAHFHVLQHVALCFLARRWLLNDTTARQINMWK